MKYLTPIIITVSIISILCGCSAGVRQLTSDRKKGEISQLLILPPVVKIKVINQGNKNQYSLAHSSAAAAEINKQVLFVIPDSVKTLHYRSSSAQAEQIATALAMIVKNVEYEKRIKGIIIPAILLNIMDTSHQDYALGIWEEGFTRSNDNYAAQKDKFDAAKLLFGEFLFGTMISDANKSKTSMVCMIIDKEKKNLAFYRKIHFPDRDPTNKNDIRALLRDLMMFYFNTAA